MSDLELVAEDVPRQTLDLVSALIAVDERSAERDSFATPTSWQSFGSNGDLSDVDFEILVFGSSNNRTGCMGSTIGGAGPGAWAALALIAALLGMRRRA